MPTFNTEEQILYDTAMGFAKANGNKKRVAKEHVDHFAQEKEPVSVFMAGSPGAGKTEVSKSLIESFSGDVLRIDNDELRNEFEGYNGSNSHIFQDPATRLLEALHDRALKRGVSFILDTTLSSYEKAKQNIERSLKRKRTVMIIFVYQDPEFAWKFVTAREKVEGRRVPPEVFINQFLSSQTVANRLKEEFGNKITIELLIKNLDGSKEIFHSNVNSIDQYLVNKYNLASLEKIVYLKNKGE
tara:strand:- start:229 stop:957 length:729 start_codon:yes stop_codon:yes gene_type:complete